VNRMDNWILICYYSKCSTVISKGKYQRKGNKSYLTFMEKILSP